MNNPRPQTILSIQSHVAYGYVGNRAAVFPLQRMGYDVIAINTVQFSNHTGYGEWSGEVFSPDHIQEILEGIKKRGVKIDALLTGYLGNGAIGDTILKAQNDFDIPLWLCDPVMGDTGRGFFVHEDIPGFFKNKASEKARIMTPNQFELCALTGIHVDTPQSALDACQVLHKRGVKTVIVTSYEYTGLAEDKIAMLASSYDGHHYMIKTPKLKLEPPPNGAGDMISALILGHILKGASLKSTLEYSAASIYGVFQKTFEAQSRELSMIQAQDEFIAPQARFEAEAVSL